MIVILIEDVELFVSQGKILNSKKSLVFFVLFLNVFCSVFIIFFQAICRRCTPGSEEFEKTDTALKALNEVVKESNEGARQMVRTEEMYFIQKNLIWKTKVWFLFAPLLLH